MNDRLSNDISRFFLVYQDRTENLLAQLPANVRKEFEEELSLLRDSILKRIAEEQTR